MTSAFPDLAAGLRDTVVEFVVFAAIDVLGKATQPVEDLASVSAERNRIGPLFLGVCMPEDGIADAER